MSLGIGTPLVPEGGNMLSGFFECTSEEQLIGRVWQVNWPSMYLLVLTDSTGLDLSEVPSVEVHLYE